MSFPRTLHIYYQNTGHERLVVTDTDKTTTLYTVYRNSSKPHMSFYRTPNIHGSGPEYLIGTASFHHFASDIDVFMVDPNNNNHITVDMKKENGLFTSSVYSFLPGAAAAAVEQGGRYGGYDGDGGRWRWERDGALTSNLKLIVNPTGHNGNGVIARFENASWSLKKQGSLEVYLGGDGEMTMQKHQQHVLDLIMVTGLARVEYQRRSAKARSGATAATNAAG
jgi:hypothetical protein